MSCSPFPVQAGGLYPISGRLAHRRGPRHARSPAASTSRSSHGEITGEVAGPDQCIEDRAADFACHAKGSPYHHPWVSVGIAGELPAGQSFTDADLTAGSLSRRAAGAACTYKAMRQFERHRAGQLFLIVASARRPLTWNPGVAGPGA